MDFNRPLISMNFGQKRSIRNNYVILIFFLISWQIILS